MSFKTQTPIFIFVLLMTVLVYTGITEAQMVTDGLISYWPFDEGTVGGKDVQDVWGKNPGVIEGNPKMRAGKVGGALDFGGNDSVDVCCNDELNFAGEEEFTVMAWVNAGDDEPVIGVVAGCCGTIVAQRDANSWALRFDGRNPGQEMEFIVQPGWQGDGGFGAPRFEKGEWHHLVGVVAGKDMFLYIDGELALEQAYGGPLVSDSAEFEIGHAGDGGFVGLIDEVALYNRSLDADEIKTNFEAKGLAVNPDGKLAARWAEIKVSR